jgi:hypothetical protein
MSIGRGWVVRTFALATGTNNRRRPDPPDPLRRL